jgi:hypothetical protein
LQGNLVDLLKKVSLIVKKASYYYLSRLQIVGIQSYGFSKLIVVPPTPVDKVVVSCVALDDVFKGYSQA